MKRLQDFRENLVLYVFNHFLQMNLTVKYPNSSVFFTRKLHRIICTHIYHAIKSSAVLWQAGSSLAIILIVYFTKRFLLLDKML